MQVKKPAQPIRIEPRWPGVLAVLAVVCLLAVLPGRISLFPAWVPYVLGSRGARADGRRWAHCRQRAVGEPGAHDHDALLSGSGGSEPSRTWPI